MSEESKNTSHVDVVEVAGKEDTGKRSKQLFILFTTAIIGVLLSVGYVLMDDEPNLPGSNVRLKGSEQKNTMGGKGSENFNRKLKEEAEEKLKIAQKKGDSFIPPVIGKDDIEAELKKEIPKAPPPQVDLKNQAALERARMLAEAEYKERLEAEIKSMQGMMLKIAESQQTLPQTIKVYTDAYPVETENETQTESTESAGNGENIIDRIEKAQPKAPFKAGQIVLATNDLHLNSDESSPVLATVIHGPQKGGKFIGGFQRENEVLILQFSKFVDKDGNEYSVSGYAVDPDLDKASVADAVDNHYLSRWGGLVAASFLKGFAEVTQQSGITSVATTGTTGTAISNAYPQYSLSKRAIIAAGEVAKQAEKIALKEFQRPPTVEVYPSHVSRKIMGILIIGI